jgi:hypothetical protein
MNLSFRTIPLSVGSGRGFPDAGVSYPLSPTLSMINAFAKSSKSLASRTAKSPNGFEKALDNRTMVLLYLNPGKGKRFFQRTF